jgi:hypothetical protein
MAKKPTDKKPVLVKPTPERETLASEPDNESAIDSRLSIPFDKDGIVLLDNMRDKTRAKLKELLTDEKLASALGVNAGDGASASGMALPPEMMYPFVSGLSIIEVLIVAKSTNAPREMVERIAPYSREEANQIAPLLAKILHKYAGGVLSKYGEEATLAFLLVTMTTAKIQAVREEMARLGPRGVVAPFVPPDTDAPPTTES